MSSPNTPYDDFDRILDTLRTALTGLPFAPESNYLTSPTTIDLDVADDSDEFVVTADVPGFTKDEIEITVSGNELRIHAEHEDPYDSFDEYLLQERNRDPETRMYLLPEPVDPTRASSRFNNGILTIRLPKRREE
ncbi:Hsp20/alpha crystallin family protein [Halobium palmae]|uniref:Hsp20/alpha crystallin family protein n=1 Tax=Halobium palmae TaxID=1776492 RepID=A0ABD5RUB2_9EURY